MAWGIKKFLSFFLVLGYIICSCGELALYTRKYAMEHYRSTYQLLFNMIIMEQTMLIFILMG